jgi:TetR/AcrR family transcriptional regulator
MVTASFRHAAAPTVTGPMPSKRDERRARQQELARTQLLDAAEEVLGEKGVYVATIKEIADRAEYSVGSVYTFFESKDELLVAVMARRGVEMSAGIVAASHGQGPVLERLVALARYEVEFFRARPAFARLYLRSSSIGTLVPDSPRARDVDAMLVASMRATAELIAEGQRRGEVCSGDPAALGRLLSGLVSAYQAVDADGRADAPHRFTIDEFCALVSRTFASISELRS